MVNGPKPDVVGFDRARQPVASGDFTPIGGRHSAIFHSILFASPEDRTGDDTLGPPEFFADLNCDQIVDAITAGRDEYNLKPFFYACLQRVDAIQYRHEVMQDLENPSLYQRVNFFAARMREVRDHLVRVQKLFYNEQQQAWFLDAVDVYCEIINSFADELAISDLRSRGFLAFRDYLSNYQHSAGFNTLLTETKELKAALAAIEYCVLTKGSSFTVRKYEAEADYSVEVEETFEKFKQGSVRDYKVKFSTGEDMNHIEAKILEFVAKLHPELFAALDAFCSRNGDFKSNHRHFRSRGPILYRLSGIHCGVKARAIAVLLSTHFRDDQRSS